MSAQTRKRQGRGNGGLEGEIQGGLACASCQFSGTKLRYFRLLGSEGPTSLPWGLSVPQGKAQASQLNTLSISRKLGIATI